LTDPYDCNIYLIDGGAGAALVDAGIGCATAQILANAAEILDPSGITHLFLTHAHPDHSGGAAGLVQALPGLRVIASPPVARWVSTGDEEAMSLAHGKAAKFYPPDYAFSTCPIHREVSEGEDLRIGNLTVEVIETPGHADGHICLLLRGRGVIALFCGDLLFFGGQISLVNNWDCRLQEYARSMAKLDGLSVDALFPGHHAFSLTAGQRHINAANRLFKSGFVPRSIV